MHSSRIQGLLEAIVITGEDLVRQLARWLDPAAARGESDEWQRQRYQRKLDVAHKIFARYDDRLEQALDARTLTPAGYLGLALVLLAAAQAEPGDVEASRARMLAGVNSAYNALDLAGDVPAGLLHAIEQECSRGLPR